MSDTNTFRKTREQCAHCTAPLQLRRWPLEGSRFVCERCHRARLHRASVDQFREHRRELLSRRALAAAALVLAASGAWWIAHV